MDRRVLGAIVAAVIVVVVIIVMLAVSASSAAATMDVHKEALCGTWSAGKEFCDAAGVKSMVCIVDRSNREDRSAGNRDFDVVFALGGDSLSYSVGRMRIVGGSGKEMRAEHDTVSGQMILPTRITLRHDIVDNDLEISEEGTVYAKLHKE